MDYYLIRYNDKFYYNNEKSGYDNTSFTLEEAQHYIKEKGYFNAELINITQELLNESVVPKDSCLNLFERSYSECEYFKKSLSYNYISNFKLPITIDSEEDYLNKLKDIFIDYKNALNKVAFRYRYNLIKDVEYICDTIEEILQSTNEARQKELLKNLLNEYRSDKFLVCELNESYPFRLLAPFKELHSANNNDSYEKMMTYPLNFYRGRSLNKGDTNISISELKDIVHIPFDIKDSCSKSRFAKQGVPCLYLSVTSKVCAEECKYNEQNQKFYLSSFKPLDVANKLKILNLVISTPLINGMNKIINNNIENKDKIVELQNSMIKIFPFVVATSFSVSKPNDNNRYEYMLSQLLTDVVSELGIDGIAYASRQGENDLQYPHGVNLVLPCNDISKEKQFSSICSMFKISKPELYREIDNIDNINKSFINECFPEKSKSGMENVTSMVYEKGHMIYYGKTNYSKFDDYLINLEHHEF